MEELNDMDEPRSPFQVPKPQPSPYNTMNRSESEKASESSPISRIHFKTTHPVPSSSFVHPQLHSVNMIKAKLQQIQQRLENDEISISTMETTSTDRQFAAKYVQKLDDEIRYKNLSSSPKKNAIQPLKKIGKKADPSWVYRKEQFGPKLEDLDIFYMKDPMVKLNMDFTTSHQPLQQQSFRCDIDPTTLQPNYNLQINHEAVFGPVDDNYEDNCSSNDDKYDIIEDKNDLSIISTIQERSWIDSVIQQI